MRRVHEHLTVDRIHAIIDLLKRSLIAAGVETPRIAVAGYNPHCGEGGLCGTEEIESIIPAIERAQSDGTQVSGPISADIVYIKARAGEFDGIVTMYHDQCQIANKLLEFDRGISIHGGTPVPTVTTAHGTAFDIVGTGRGNTQPLARAVAIAAKIAGNRDLYD
jgi:4-hydroxythreonine-4-phosphate dehydrogenase